MTVYPIEIDSSLNLPEAVDAISAVNAQTINRLREAIIAIETELGVKPSNVYGTVRQYLDTLNSTIETLNDDVQAIVEFSAGGDLSGTPTSQSVVGIRGRPLSSATPSVGNVLIWNGSTWAPGAQSGGGGGGGTTVQTGANYGHFFDVVAFANTPSTDENVFINGGSLHFDPTVLTAANGTRTIKLRIIGETTSPLMTIQLYNLTANAVVTGSTLTTSSSTATLLVTPDLSSNLTNGPAIYQVQIKMAAGTPTDRVTLVYAALRVEWS